MNTKELLFKIGNIMKVYRLKRIQKIPVPIKEAWNFFSDPRNLSKITPGSLDFQIIDGSSDISEKVYQGMIIQYRIKPLLGIPVTWVTEIARVDEPNVFIDVQKSGPYRFWHHQHIFKEIEGGTEMTDLVHYAVPFGIPGRIVEKLIIRKQLKMIFDFRKNYLIERYDKY